jgi:pyruvate kinase
MMNMVELDTELKKIANMKLDMPLYYDIKGRQLRVTEWIKNDNYLDIRLNHAIQVDTPTPVLFKAGADVALLHEVSEDGKRLKFLGGPKYLVKEGESLHIRDESLQVFGDQFTPIELEKIHKVRDAGFKHWFLSYVQTQEDVDEFRKLVGDDCEVMLKIEDKRGLDYVKHTFVKTPNTKLVLARGDMYVELERPHEILNATRLLIQKDPDALCGSRLLLSTITDPVPSCADWNELAWIADIGYKNMMLCDELCLKEELLSRAVNAFQAFKENYNGNTQLPTNVSATGLKPRIRVLPRTQVPAPSPVAKSSAPPFGKGWWFFGGRTRST